MFSFRTELQQRVRERFMETELRNFPSQQDALEEFTHQWNSGVYNDTLEMQLWDLFEQAESCGNGKDAAVYYHKILELEPENVDAKRELISHIEHKGKRIIEIEAFIQSLQKPRKLDWLVAETRPYTRCLIDLAGYYLDCGCYDEAIATYIPVFHGDKNNRSHFLIHMMVACCGAADWKQGQKVFKRYLDSTDDFQSMMTTPVDMTLPMHLLYILLGLQCGESKQIREYLEDLLDEYEDIQWILKDARRWNDFIRRGVELAQHIDKQEDIDTDMNELITTHLLLQQLPSRVVSNDSILWQRLFDVVEGITKEQIENRYSTDGYLPGSDLPSNMREMIQAFLEDRIKNYKMGSQPAPNIENPLLKGLGISQQMSLGRHQLVSLEDFKNVTKKEVLAVPGIGKKAIEKLEANGVIFKKP